MTRTYVLTIGIVDPNVRECVYDHESGCYYHILNTAWRIHETDDRITKVTPCTGTAVNVTIPKDNNVPERPTNET